MRNTTVRIPFICSVARSALVCACACRARAEALTIATLAGTPAGAEDGPGTTALFNFPNAVAVDASGNIYVADSFNNSIRRIAPSGRVTTLAGHAPARGFVDGTSASAAFNQPDGIAVDPQGNVIVADSGNNTIRKITPGGVVTTLAGSALAPPGSSDGAGPTARFNSPEGVAIDAAGIIYVVELNNSTVRKIALDGSVTTLAGVAGQTGSADGKGTARFNQPRGIAVSASGNVYVGDSGNNTIRRIASDGTVSTIAGKAGKEGTNDGAGSVARFDDPEGLAVDAAGNIYVADGVNSTVRKITPGGVVTTLAGASLFYDDVDATAARFNFPTGVALDLQGNVVVADSTNNAIRRIDSNNQVTTVAGPRDSASFFTPGGMAVAPDGSIFLADSGDLAIRKIGTDGKVSVVAGRLGFDGFTKSADALKALFNDPVGIALDASGNLFVSDAINSVIQKITPDGSLTTFAGKGFARGSDDGVGSKAQFNTPQGMAITSTGILYVADTYSHTIRKILPDGTVSTFAGKAGQNGSVDGVGSAARLSYPWGVALDAAGNLYVPDAGNHAVRKITPNGTVTTLAGSVQRVGNVDGPGNVASFEQPEGIAVDAAGFVYVADSVADLIRKITPAGVVSTLAGVANTGGASSGTGGFARFDEPSALAIDANGHLLISDLNNGLIRIGTPALTDTAAIDASIASPAIQRQLSVLNKSATAFNWRILLQPPDSVAAFSDPSLSNPVFTPDIAGNYIFELDASSSAGTSMTRVALEVLSTPIVVDIFQSLDNPGFMGAQVRFLYAATAARQNALQYSIDFGDGSPTNITSNPQGFFYLATHAYTTPGDYTATLTVSNGIDTAAVATMVESIPAPNSGADGVQNVAVQDAAIVNPVTQTTLGLTASNGGVIAAQTNLDDSIAAGLQIATDFSDVEGRSARVFNSRPVHKYENPGIYVAKTTATNSAGNVVGSARKMLVISSKETGMQTMGGTGQAADNTLTPISLKGKFSFAASASDTVSFSGSFKLPPNLNPFVPHPFSFGIGNIVASTMLDAHGKGTLPSSPPVLKSLKVAYRGIAKGKVSQGGEVATLTVTLSKAGLVAAGFDTEGITNRAQDATPGGAAVARNIQAVMLIDGQPYRALVPVLFSISNNSDFGSVQGRR